LSRRLISIPNRINRDSHGLAGQIDPEFRTTLSSVCFLCVLDCDEASVERLVKERIGILDTALDLAEFHRRMLVV
jgi:hypothetical protein